jgi:hypothetical protein
MRSPLRIVTMLLGAFFAFQGLLWIFDPARAAAGLGMPLLDGLARSTQIGDLAAFFLTIGATVLVGSRPGRARLLLVPAGVLGSAALVRTLAWLMHDAAFASAFIGVELVSGALLLLAAHRLDAAG